jgi:osmoprotectant transport system ATP-binding protein
MIMNEGRICKFDRPEEILKNPADSIVRSLTETAVARESFWRDRL